MHMLKKLKDVGLLAAGQARKGALSAKAKVQSRAQSKAAASGEQYIVALDIGTEYVKALVGKVTKETGEVEIIGVGRAHQSLTDMQAGAIADIASVVDNCDKALNAAETQAGVSARTAILGIAGELVKGTTTTVRVARKNPTNPLDLPEMEKIIALVQERAEGKAKQQLAWELGGKSVDVRLVNSALVSIEIDGYPVTNPIGFQGKDVVVQLYTAFAPLIHIGALEKTAQELDLDLLAVAIPSTFLACTATAMIMMLIDKLRGSTALDTHPEYLRRLADGTLTPATTGRQPGTGVPQGGAASPAAAVPVGDVLVRTLEEPVLSTRQIVPSARASRRSVLIFLGGLVAVLGYATAISEKVGLITEPVMTRDAAIISIMLSVAALIVLACRVQPGEILSASTFTSGMSASICVLGVAWLGTTFVTAHESDITDAAGDLLTDQPWTLAVVLFFASALLYSQAATTKALLPTALAIGVSPLAAIAAFPAVSALFVLPTYPTLLAAVEMDDTGTTQIGKYVFNHPFLLPGVINITIAVALGFLFGSLIL